MSPHTLWATSALAVALLGANANASTTPIAAATTSTTAQPTSVPGAGSASVAVAADVPVRALIAAMQAQDAAAIRAQFAPTATQAYGATAKWLQSDIIERHGKVADPEFSVNGNEVVVRGQYQSTGDTSRADFLFTIENGLITSWRMRY